MVDGVPAVRPVGRPPPTGVSHRLVPHVDLSATILQAARATGEFRVDGRTILGKGRSRVVLEGMAAGIESAGEGWMRPPFCGGRTRRYLYVKWSGDPEAELYDYRREPLELATGSSARVQDERLHCITGRGAVSPETAGLPLALERLGDASNLWSDGLVSVQPGLGRMRRHPSSQ